MKRLSLVLVVALLSLTLVLHAFFAPGDLTLEQAATGNAESDLFLKYQAHENDFLIFYDAAGALLFLRYRRDRWDYDNDPLRDLLRRGITYRVRCRNLVKLPEGELPPGVTGSGLPRVQSVRKIRRIREVYAAELGSVTESALRDLRY